MNTYVRDLWIDALHNYTQTVGILREGDAYCVGGVLCDLHSKATGFQWERDHEGWSYLDVCAVPPKAVLMWAQLHADECSPLMDANDSGVTFPELAQRIMAL